jgi:hypothetical protein
MSLYELNIYKSVSNNIVMKFVKFKNNYGVTENP